jgi:hypothetical protein
MPKDAMKHCTSSTVTVWYEARLLLGNGPAGEAEQKVTLLYYIVLLSKYQIFIPREWVAVVICKQACNNKQFLRVNLHPYVLYF